jgi:glucose-1-phosphate adenylyltransferase
MRTDEHERIVDFVEKPQTEAELALVRSGEGRYWASLGIYFFEINVLMKLLGEVKGMDFGRDVIPHAVRGAYRVAAHSFSGYWEDIGTIASFFAANLGLVCPMPPINLFDPSWTMYTRPRFLPPTKVERSALEAVLLADGSLIHSAAIKRSVVGIRTVIRQDTTVEDSILMGADYYVPDDNASALPTMGIGRGCRIRRAIVDKNVRIGDGCRIVNEQNRQNADGPGWSIRDGIVVIEKNAVIPPETVI